MSPDCVVRPSAAANLFYLDDDLSYDTSWGLFSDPRDGFTLPNSNCFMDPKSSMYLDDELRGQASHVPPFTATARQLPASAFSPPFGTTMAQKRTSPPLTFTKDRLQYRARRRQEDGGRPTKRMKSTSIAATGRVPENESQLGISLSQGFGDGCHDEDDDDGSSTCSSCPDSCPSHCGETGQGSICCDADNCEAQASEDLCIDAGCEGAVNPCTDANCLGDAFTMALDDIGAPSRIGEETAAAAATLTLIGEVGDTGSTSSFSNSSQFLYLGNDFTFAANPQLSNQNDQHTHGMDLRSMHPVGDGELGKVNPASNTSGNRIPYNMPCITPQSAEYINHITQYHVSSQDHIRPCVADNPAFVGTRCPLPTLDYEEIDFGFLLDESPDLQCGYSFQDADTFTSHLKTQHKSLLSNMAALNSNFPYANWNQFHQPNHNNGQGFLDTDQGNYHFQISNFQDSSPSVSSESLRQITSLGPSGSSMGLSSTMTTPVPTPKSPSTSPVEKPSYSSTRVSTQPFDALGSSVNAPRREQSFEHRSTTPGNLRQSQSLGPQNVYQCFWRDAETGEACHENFDDSDQLDAHCREHHTRPLEGRQGGFRCMWQSCKRGAECFQTKAKLNRHLQTHTGFKPMKCHICGLRLSAKQALDQHIRTHTNEKPYVCQYGCGRTFKQHSALTMHHRTHTKEKPLKCETCGAVFTESSNLSKHRRTHEVKGMYKCELCDKDFHRLDQLRRHVASSHKDRPEDGNRAIERAKSWNTKGQNGNRPQTMTTSASHTPTIGLLQLGSERNSSSVSIKGIKTER